MLDSSTFDGLPFSGNNNDPRDMELTEYDRERRIHRAHTETSEAIPMSTRTLGNELVCPICLDLLTNTMTTKECLHRFCADCITRALAHGNKECPTCRKKLVSRRSLRPDPNFDKLIEKIWPNRKMYELMQNKSLEVFTQQSSMDSLRSSIEEGMKAQAATRRQRVPGSYDSGDGEQPRRRKRKRNADGEFVECDENDPDGESIDGDFEGDDAGSNGSNNEVMEEYINETSPEDNLSENGEIHEESLGTSESDGDGTTDCYGNVASQRESDVGINGNGLTMGDELLDEESAGGPDIDSEMDSDCDATNGDLTATEPEEEEIYTEDDLEEWEEIALAEDLDDSQDLGETENGADILDIDSDSSTETTESTSESTESILTLSELSDDNTVPAHNGTVETEEVQLPSGPCSLRDRMSKWLAQSPNSPQTPDENELVRMNEDDLMEVDEDEPEIEAEFLPSVSLAKRAHFRAILEPRYLRTRYDTTFAHIGEFLHERFQYDTCAVYKDFDYKGVKLSIADIEKPEFFYVFSRQGGHHIKRIFLHENIHTAHGSCTKGDHLVVFFDTRPHLLASDTQSVLEAVVPKQFLDLPVV